MAVKANLLTIPAEVREQILHHYFRVDGGYVYDGDSDCLKTAVGNHSIDLALLFTCRTVANEARHLPLSLNTIKFTTLYRRDLNKLAGCFNFVSGLYHHIQADLVVLLAKFLTPEMRTELALEYPGFAPPLAMAVDDRDNSIELSTRQEDDGVDGDSAEQRRRDDLLASVISGNRTYKGDDSAASAAKTCMKNQLSDTFCRWAEMFIHSNEGHRKDYVAFSNLERNADSSYRGFPGSFWRAENFWSHALELLAQEKPSEFSRQVYTTFPQWIDHHSAQAFLDMRFEHWAIPSQAHVERAIEPLALQGMWDVPDMWHDAHHPEPWRLTSNLDIFKANASTPRVRCREKIRFSAVASAIRFLETRIHPQQRLDIQTLLLHEDFPSVNVPSAHAQGLAPFFRENPRLRVERRVDLMRCIYGALEQPSIVAARFQLDDDLPEEKIIAIRFRMQLTQWLLDALAVTSVGIPADSFTLILEAGSYRDWFTDLFQQRYHKEIAWRRAFEHLQRINSFGERNWMHGTIEDAMIQHDEIEAFETLMNKTSPILCADFSTGIPSWDVDTIVNDTQSLSLHLWFWNWGTVLPSTIMEPPTHQVDYKVRLADNYEVQTD